MRRPTGSPKRSAGRFCRLASIAASVAALLLLPACRTMAPPPALTAQQLVQAQQILERPLPGTLAALYRLRVPSSGGLRLSILARGRSGRLSVSEPFGSAVSLTAWKGGGHSQLFDLETGCVVASSQLPSVAGVATLPLPQAMRLLGGRLPALQGDRVTVEEGGWLRISGVGFSFSVRVAPDPWRVVEVREVGEGWRILLDEHTQALPGFVRLEHPQRRWAELELVKLQWDSFDELPPLPDLPRCEELRTNGGG